jgi:hypothetical protein
VDVDIEEAHTFSGHHQGGCQVHGNGALADAALSGQHNDFMPDPAEPGLELLTLLEFLVAFVLVTFCGGAGLVSAGTAGARFFFCHVYGFLFLIHPVYACFYRGGHISPREHEEHEEHEENK